MAARSGAGRSRFALRPSRRGGSLAKRAPVKRRAAAAGDLSYPRWRRQGIAATSSSRSGESGRAREAESDAGEERPTRNAFFLFEAGKRKRLDDLPESSCGNSRCTGGEVAADASVKTLVAVLARRRSPNAAGYLFRTTGRLPLRELDPGEFLNVSAAQAATPEPRPPAFPVRRAASQPERFRNAYRFAPDSPCRRTRCLSCALRRLPLRPPENAASRGQRLYAAVEAATSVQRKRSRKRSRLRGDLGAASWETLFGVFRKRPPRRDGSCRGRRFEFAGGAARRCRNLFERGQRRL